MKVTLRIKKDSGQNLDGLNTVYYFSLCAVHKKNILMLQGRFKLLMTNFIINLFQIQNWKTRINTDENTLKHNSLFLSLLVSVSVWLHVSLMLTRLWCCRRWRYWWSFWSSCPKTRITTTLFWRSSLLPLSRCCLGNRRSNMWPSGTLTLLCRNG